MAITTPVCRAVEGSLGGEASPADGSAHAVPAAASSITRLPILSAAQCLAIAEQVVELRARWRHAGDEQLELYHLGANVFANANPRFGQSYEDYLCLASRDRAALRERFAPLYARLEQALAEVLGEPVRRTESLADPGFMIWDRYGGAEPPRYPLHVDSQYRLLPWSRIDPSFDGSSVFTATLPVALPPDGGALVTRGHCGPADRLRMLVEPLARVVSDRPAEHHPYTVGTALMHRGLVAHAPVAPATLPRGQRRIVLQAHGARVDGGWLLYW